MKNQKGITLLSLIITIIVMLILAGVSLSTAIGEGAIINRAGQAKSNYEEAEKNEIKKIAEASEQIGIWIGELPAIGEESHIGLYADLDGNGIISEENDGIIYMDLVSGALKNTALENSIFGAASYTIPDEIKLNVDNAKSYEKSAEELDGPYGKKFAVKLKSGTEGSDRFFVMALKDLGGKDATYCWYDAAHENGIVTETSLTETKFGSGKENTRIMIEKWNEPAYGKKDDGSKQDIWGLILDGWFLPSKDEMLAFHGELDVNKDTYMNFNMALANYWTSSLAGTKTAHSTFVILGSMNTDINSPANIRLSTTF